MLQQCIVKTDTKPTKKISGLRRNDSKVASLQFQTSLVYDIFWQVYNIYFHERFRSSSVAWEGESLPRATRPAGHREFLCVRAEFKTSIYWMNIFKASTTWCFNQNLLVLFAIKKNLTKLPIRVKLKLLHGIQIDSVLATSNI